MNQQQAPIQLTHPESEQRIEVGADQLDRYVVNGWRAAEVGAPAGNASFEAWAEFARSKGFTEDQIVGQSRDDLRAALS
ncbi:MAG: hypothetical protein F2667_04405 [Actinobacteria bacterium]|nr:hypothetical protein [Actinomycetota bacterium]